METLVAITAIVVSMGWAFFATVAGAALTDPNPKTDTLSVVLWISLNAMAIGTAFLAGRIWP